VADAVAAEADLDGDGLIDWVGVVMDPPSDDAHPRHAQVFVLMRTQDGKLRLDSQSRAFAFLEGGGRNGFEIVDVPAPGQFVLQFNSRSVCAVNAVRYTFTRQSSEWRLSRLSREHADACDATDDQTVEIDYLTSRATLTETRSGVRRTSNHRGRYGRYGLADFDPTRPYGLDRFLFGQ